MTNVKLASIVVTAMLTAPALAEPASPDRARCAEGIELATGKDLARAALYLEGCAGDAAEQATAMVGKQLRASALSALSIVSDSPSVVVSFETDAMPGEQLATPATIWAKAGTYKLRATSGVIETTLTARSRATVVLHAAAPHVRAPRDGAVSFLDEPTDPTIAAPPPAQHHPSLLPCKYDGCDTHGGEVLVDPLAPLAPLAYEAKRLPPYPPALRVGVRVGIVDSDHVAPTFAVAARWQLLTLRVDGSRRGYDHERYADLGATAGIAQVIASPRAAWVSLGVGLRGDLRVDAPLATSRAGAGANAELELALRSMPISLAARYEQGFAGEHAVILELGGDWRVFN